MESKKYTLEQEQIARFAKANWKIASMLFSKFFGQCVCKKESCCE